jgi:hypothetical protein
MKPIFSIYLLLLAALSGCSDWTVQPISYNTPPTPIPSQTPSIQTATPNIILPTLTATLSEPSVTPTQLTDTITPMVDPTSTEIPPSPIIPPTLETVPPESLKIDLLGCNTSVDITHGMGEVTNAYVTVGNLGTTDLDNVCATLRGKDEDRPHPDKTKCISSLPAGFQATLKLTIDTTYKQNSPIQVDITSNDVLLERLGKDTCKDIGLFSPDADDFGNIKRIP